MARISKNNLVAQANSLIEARYSITKNEQILLFAMISLINPNDKEFLTFTIESGHLAEILEIDKKSALRELELVIARLMSRVIKINTPTGWKMYQWVKNAELEGNIVSLKFHDDLKPYLLALKASGNFTQTRLGIAVSFKSLYTIRIYQLLREYESKRMTYFEFSLEEFRNMLLGDKSKKYPLFKDLKKYSINVAKKELETKDPDTGFFTSDLSFNLETRRTGRKISHLKFIIKKQRVKPIKPITIVPQAPENPHKDTPEFNGMLDIGVSEKHALAFLAQHSPAYIAEKLRVLAERQQVEDIISPSGFFIKALQQDYKSEACQREAKEAERRAREEEARQREALARRKEALASEYGKVARNAFIEALSQDEKNQLVAELSVPYQDNDFILKDIQKNGIASMMLASALLQKIPDYHAKKEAYIVEKLQQKSVSTQ